MHQSELHPGSILPSCMMPERLKPALQRLGCDVTQTLIDDLNYVNVTYSGSPAYLHSAADGQSSTFLGMRLIPLTGRGFAPAWPAIRCSFSAMAAASPNLQTSGAFSWVEPETGVRNQPDGDQLSGQLLQDRARFPTRVFHRLSLQGIQ